MKYHIEIPIAPGNHDERWPHLGYHSALFARYFLSYRGENIIVSNPKDIRYKLHSSGRASRYSHFEVRLNDNLCTVNVGDLPYNEPKDLNLSKSNVHFICQIGKKYKNRMMENYLETGKRIYPLPLPLFHNSREIYFSKKYDLNKEKEYVSNMFFSTKSRTNRLPWIKFAKKNKKIFYVDKLSGKDYLDFCINRQSWGINLMGHGKDGKCYRESEFMYLGIPLALNYDPYYPFPFNEGEHYVRLRKPSDIMGLMDIDLAKFASKSKELGETFIQQEGYLDLMLKCINQKEYNPSLVN